MSFAAKDTITIDYTKCGSSDSSNFPVLVYLSDSRIKTVANGGLINNTGAQSGGITVTMPFDLIFTSDSAGSTKIPWEIKSYDGTNGILWAWVKIATVSSSANTVFYGWFGDASVNTQQNTGSYSVANVWDSYNGVFHLSDGTTFSAKDSTGTADGTNHGVTASAGKVGGGGSFVAASSQYVDIARTGTSLNPITVSCWINLTDNTENQYMGGRGYNGSTGFDFAVGADVSTKLSWRSYNGSTHGIVGTGAVVSAGVWTHVVATYGSNSWKLYVNGSLNASASDATGPINNGAGYSIGTILVNGSPAHFLNGNLDEYRLSSVARSADWILTEYNNQNSPSTFLSHSIALLAVGSTTPLTLLGVM